MSGRKICMVSGVLIGIIFTGLILAGKQEQERRHRAKMQKELAGQVFRFHVLANSDSEEDQDLKMQVKEEVLSYMKRELPDAESAKETEKWAKAHLQELTETAQTVIEREGYSYPVRARVLTCDFPEKTYGDVTFPAGKYEALRIEIGQAQGQNWWCVLYPNLCFIDTVRGVVPAKGKRQLRTVLEEDTYRMVTGKNKVKVKWYFLR